MYFQNSIKTKIEISELTINIFHIFLLLEKLGGSQLPVTCDEKGFSTGTSF